MAHLWNQSVHMLEPITTMNLVLCVVIVALAVAAYSMKKIVVGLYIGIAFGLFGISHLVTLLGYAESLTTVLIAVRTLAYLIVIFALLTLWKR